MVTKTREAKKSYFLNGAIKALLTPLVIVKRFFLIILCGIPIHFIICLCNILEFKNLFHTGSGSKHLGIAKKIDIDKQRTLPTIIVKTRSA